MYQPLPAYVFLNDFRKFRFVFFIPLLLASQRLVASPMSTSCGAHVHNLSNAHVRLLFCRCWFYVPPSCLLFIECRALRVAFF